MFRFASLAQYPVKTMLKSCAVQLLLLVAPAALADVVRISSWPPTNTDCSGDPTFEEDFTTWWCVSVEVFGQPDEDFSYDIRCDGDTVEARIYAEGDTDCNGGLGSTTRAVDTNVCLDEQYFCINPNASVCGRITKRKLEFECFSDDPCFARETSYACRITEPTVTAGDAFTSCFADGTSSKAERVLMTSLRAGDLVLSHSGAQPSISRVIVNQHVQSDHTSVLMHMKHSEGTLSVTADHVVLVDGEFLPARFVKVGSKLVLADLDQVEVEQVTRSRDGIINPITSDGKILAAGPTGLPVVAATGNEWLADVMLSGYGKYSLSFNLAVLFPAAVQAYYDSWLEAGFHAAVPTLAALKAAAPAPVVVAGVVAGDLVLAFGLLVFSVSSFEVLSALVVMGLLAKRCLSKAKKA